MNENTEPTAEDLDFELEEAREMWYRAARLQSYHSELANYYQNGSRDTRTINQLWAVIDEDEAWLRENGVEL